MAADKLTIDQLLAELVEALGKLAREAQGFVSMADRQSHGNTNIAVMRERIAAAFAAIAKAENHAKEREAEK